MNPRVLMMVTGDPRKSHRPAEALRIAAGVGTWEKTDVTVYLRGEAVRTLGDTSGLVDENDYAQYWTILASLKQPIYVEKSSVTLAGLGEAVVPFREISDEELADLAAEQKYVLRF